MNEYDNYEDDPLYKKIVELGKQLDELEYQRELVKLAMKGSVDFINYMVNKAISES